MVDLIRAAVLGLVQGLTEFLPVSSSGHLILMRDVFGWQMLGNEHLNKMFDVVLHTGTFLALVMYFHRDIVRLARAFAASLRYGIRGDAERRLAWAIALGTIPAAIFGLTAQDLIETRLGTPMLVAAELMVFAVILWWAEVAGRKQRALGEAEVRDGVWVGLAQALALAPGVSRSGITMTAGLARGMKKETAARFSFLLSIPVVGGTAAYSILSLIKHPGALPPGSMGMFVVGLLAAAFSGYFVIGYLLRYLQTRSLAPFVVYRLALGAVLLVWFGVLR
jgi:undecaprenyl-diphosphatase